MITAGTVSAPPAIGDFERFVRENTRLLAPPLVPEIRLHLAEESLPIWQKTEEELGELNVPPPFWAFAWAGGQALARYILDNRALAERQHVLDLGSGSGLAGIAAAKSGARSVLAADVDPFSIASIRLNAAVNAAEIATTSDDLLATDDGTWNLVLIADLFYERALAERVMRFARASAERGAAVLVGDPRRSYFPRDAFVEVAEYKVPVTQELEDAELKRTSVWRLP
ncbi:MAG: methyltransferase [Hyphomicrobium sp.]|nr:methyltransferase [Hyphomicrobium sp.]